MTYINLKKAYPNTYTTKYSKGLHAQLWFCTVKYKQCLYLYGFEYTLCSLYCNERRKKERNILISYKKMYIYNKKQFIFTV